MSLLPPDPTSPAPPFSAPPRPWAEEPAATPPPHRRQPRWLLPLVGVLVVLLGVAGFRWLPTDPENADAGDCVEVSDVSEESASVRIQDCAETAAVYQVTNTVPARDVCSISVPPELLPGGAAAAPDVAPATPDEVVVGDTKLCLQLGLEEGECIVENDELIRSVACTDPAAELEVALRVDGQDDESLCDQVGEDLVGVIHYPRHPLTYCFTAPAGV